MEAGVVASSYYYWKFYPAVSVAVPLAAGVSLLVDVAEAVQEGEVPLAVGAEPLQSR
jgi:hypothetical protein